MVDAWWQCDACDAWLDVLGPLLVDAAEWQRRRDVPHERKALLALTGLAMGALLALGAAVVPQALSFQSGWVLGTLRAAAFLLFGLYLPLALLAILVGALTG